MPTMDSSFVQGAAVGAIGAAALYNIVQAFVAAQAEKEELSTTSNNHDGNVYETSKAVAEYLQFHYGNPEDVMPYPNGPVAALSFPANTAQIATQWARKVGLELDAALDIGCAVGRSSFEFSKDFKQVVGIDFSHAFVKAANDMKKDGKAKYTATIQSDIKGNYECVVPAGVNGDRVTFEQGDACNIDSKYNGKFSVIHGANLVCRLPEPMAFLSRLPGLLVKGGLVVLISPHSWLKQYTAKGLWLGGYTGADGVARRGEDGLETVMTKLGFKLIHDEQTPFVIREHIRKFQWGCSHCTVWQLQ